MADPNAVLVTSRRRVLALLIGMGLCGFVLVAQAVKLQVIDTEFLQGEGEARFLRQVEIPTMRGSIVDRNGEPLAVSTPVESVWAHPGELLQEASDRIPMLASLLGQDAEAIERRLTQRADRQFVWIIRRIPPHLADRVRELDIPGVFLQREYRRFYPTAEISSQVVGFTNIDEVGQEGLELAYDNWLTGQTGAKRVIQDRLGRIVEDVELIREALPGRELRLTIDRRLQDLAYRELMATIARHQARSGSVVVLDIPTGEVLAMVNYPSYNPNGRSRSSDGMRNRALTDVLEPGSIVKPFVVAAAMEAGIAHPEMLVDTSPGTMQVSGHTIRDIRNFGEMSVTGLLTKSSNVGIVQLAMAMDASHLWSMYSRLGFGDVTGTGFPGESAGVLRDHERWRKLEQATLSYGYGLSVTPLQLARAIAAIADQGRLRQPSFILDSDNPPQAIIDPLLAEQVSQMLETVTQTGGTATRAAVDGYRVAAKTGTSRKSSAGGYSNKYVASIAGFAPMVRPRIAVVAVVNEPSAGDYYGGLVAAPLFGQVMKDALRLMNVPPDDMNGLMALNENGVDVREVQP